MDNRKLAWLAVAAAALFLVLNFTMEGGTMFLILAVLSGLAAAYLLTRKSR